MGTIVTAATLLANQQNRASSIKTAGTQANAMQANQVTGKLQPVDDQQQQANIVARQVNAMPKGSNLTVTVTNSHATDTQSFILFDCIGLALANGAAATGADIDFTTTFAGNSPYANLLEYIVGARMASLGSSFQVSNETVFSTSQMKVWNGNIEDYNSKSLVNYFKLAKDNYANDQKLLNIQSVFYINSFLAISGSLKAQESIDILLNIVGHKNF